MNDTWSNQLEDNCIESELNFEYFRITSICFNVFAEAWNDPIPVFTYACSRPFSDFWSRLSFELYKGFNSSLWRDMSARQHF